MKEALRDNMLLIVTGPFLFAMVLTFAQLAYASGDKHSNPWQPVPEDECSVFLPAGIDEDKCEIVDVSQSGISYLCSGISAFCPTAEDKDD